MQQRLADDRAHGCVVPALVAPAAVPVLRVHVCVLVCVVCVAGGVVWCGVGWGRATAAAGNFSHEAGMINAGKGWEDA